MKESNAWLVKHTTNIWALGLKFCNKISERIVPTCVFPVPGGPWINPILFLRQLWIAINCDLSNKFLNSWGYIPLVGFNNILLYL